MSVRKPLIAAVVATGAAVAAVGFNWSTAFADDFVPMGTSTVKNVSDVYAGQFGPKHNLPVATVSFDYTCHGTTETDHLFIAVKQGPNVQVGSSSSDAVTFYSTNLRSDQKPNALNCDGAKHTMHAVLAPDPGFAQSGPHPALANGPSFLQICLYDSTGLNMNYTDTEVHVRS
jgi:hypothetical protein